MKKTSKTIVFFGSGPVAKSSLEFLVQHFTVEAVITKPVTAREMAATAPKSKLYTVENKQDLTKLMNTSPFKSSLGVIVDFGIIVEQSVIDYFPLGIINSHFSLLPEWRGADPISFAILSGQKKTGVSLMLIVDKLDEGPLLAQSSMDIGSATTTPELTDQLVELSNRMLAEILPLYMDGQLVPYEQPEDEKPTYSRKLTKADSVLDWSKSAERLEREVRAFAVWPKSRTVLGGKDVIVTKSTALPLQSKPGEVAVRNKQLVVYCAKGALRIDRLKPAGKPEMDTRAFLAGYKIS